MVQANHNISLKLQQVTLELITTVFSARYAVIARFG
jgi:hypothetical protein